jgi:hypothetical protein
MSEVRVLVQGIAKDYDAFVSFMRRETSLLEEIEPETLLMEIFADPETRQVVVHERYSDPDAFIAHSSSLMEGTRLQEFLAVFDFKRMTFLAGAEDERVATAAQQFNAIHLSQVAGFAR